MVRARVLPDDHDQVGVLGDVDQADVALADAQRLVEGEAAGLVAHVRAVGQVVGAQAAREQLVDERRLVARPAARVERGAVRVGKRAQLLGDEIERVVPADRPVMRAARSQVHGLGQPALRLEPVVGLPAKLLDRVGGEEAGVDALAGGLPRDRLGAVLAELGRLAMVRIGPGAARAVEAVDLVRLQQGLQAALRAHLMCDEFDGVLDARQPRRGPLRGRDGGLLVPICGHGPTVGSTARRHRGSHGSHDHAAGDSAAARLGRIAGVGRPRRRGAAHPLARRRRPRRGHAHARPRPGTRRRLAGGRVGRARPAGHRDDARIT